MATENTILRASAAVRRGPCTKHVGAVLNLGKCRPRDFRSECRCHVLVNGLFRSPFNSKYEDRHNHRPSQLANRRVVQIGAMEIPLSALRPRAHDPGRGPHGRGDDGTSQPSRSRPCAIPASFKRLRPSLLLSRPSDRARLGSAFLQAALATASSASATRTVAAS
jgi:hypothetical protein